MNELLNTEAEELGSELRPSNSSEKKKDGESFGTRSQAETEVISVHISCNVENSDDLLKLCGDSGAWQILIFFLASCCGFSCAIHNFLYIFISDTPDYYCTFPEVDHSVYQESDLKNLLLPRDRDLGTLDKCSRYRTEVEDGFITNINHSLVEKCNTELVPIQYESQAFYETIGTQWSLVCQNAYWLPAVESIYMFGVLVGSIVFGMLSDKIGRRGTIWIATFMFVVFSPAIAFSNNFWTLLVFRFCLGMASPGLYSTSYVLVVEIIGSHRRSLAGLLFSIPYSVGYMVVPIIAYFIRDWRNLQLCCSALAPLMILTWWFLPESPRWLLIKGRVTQAEELFREIARINGKDLPKDFHHLVKKVARAEKKVHRNSTCDQSCRKCMSAFCKLMQTPVLRYRVFCMAIAFLAVSLIYYGIAINPTNLGLDRYLFTFLCGLFEIPAEIFVVILLQRNGRRIVFSGFFLICGTILLLSLPLPKGSNFDIPIFVLAQLFISGNATLIYLYSAELFPTEIRGYCLGITSMIGRMGSIAVPYIVELVGEKHKTYPTIVFGSVALIAGTFSLLLPETRNKKLPETVAEVEEGRH